MNTNNDPTKFSPKNLVLENTKPEKIWSKKPLTSHTHDQRAYFNDAMMFLCGIQFFILVV